MLQNAGVKDGETSVNQEEATSTSPNTPQGRRNSSQVAVVNATAKDKCGAVRNRLVLQNKTANTTPDENKFFDPGGEQNWCALPSRPLPSLGRAECAKSLYCYGLSAWRHLVVGCSGSMIWELSLAPNIFMFLLTPVFPCFFENMYPNFEQVVSEKTIKSGKKAFT